MAAPLAGLDPKYVDDFCHFDDNDTFDDAGKDAAHDPREQEKTLPDAVAVRSVNNVLTRLGRQVASDIEKEYRHARETEIERLHEGFVEVVKNQNPSTEAVIFVLRQFEYQLLQEHYELNVSPAQEAARKL